ncbi:glycosyltransferase [Mixta hanseatica]|uniref:Glycosyltransferase n=1 Tax=Mixta hanseatica TaxID=2872648 RepID=A0ABY4R3S8_9GAMM|nr:glycosyltransferase [Mixta hanseatica]UQY42733.1 glycosyltransferase [Mixta hanseatica]
MSRILICSNHLEKLQGSELVTLELVEFMLDQGWYVDVFTHLLGGDIQNEFESLPNQERLLVTDDDSYPFEQAYDIVWIQHTVLNAYMIERLCKEGTNTRFIFNHMSSFASMEMPLDAELENRLAAVVLAVSHECAEMLVKKGIKKEKIILFDNPAPVKFADTPVEYKETLKNVLCISNHPPQELFEAQQMLVKQGVRCDMIGAAGKQLRVSPALIASYDAIITIGKSVQYALVAGIPVYIYDMYGGEGYLTESNFTQSAWHNFSGRATKQKREAAKICQELIDGFEQAQRYVLQQHSEFIQRWSLTEQLPALLAGLAEPQHYQLSDEESRVLSIHNKAQRQGTAPVWSYKKWTEARALSQHRLAATEAILRNNDAACRIDIIVINAGDVADTMASLHSVMAQHYQADNIWVTGQHFAETTTLPINVIHQQESWCDGITQIAEKSQADLLLVLHAGDCLLPHSLLKLAEHKLRYPSSLIFYFDEEASDAQGGINPMLKPDTNIDLLRSYPYIGRTLAFERGLLPAVNGLNPASGEFALIDMVWKAIEAAGPGCVKHIDHVSVRAALPLLCWLNSSNNDLYQQVINEHFKRFGIAADINSAHEGSALKIRYHHQCNYKVSIIISTKNNYKTLRQCIESLMEKTAYHHYEIIIVDNGSTDSDMVEYLQKLKALNISQLRLLEWDGNFNYAKINNFAVNAATGELLLFINDDIEAFESDWLDEMISHALRPEVGLVGARLITKAGIVQHGGIVLGLNGVAGTVNQGLSSTSSGYMNRLKVAQNMSALSSACLMIKKEAFLSINGFDDKDFPQHFTEIDLALRLSQQGYLHVWTPYATLFQTNRTSLYKGENRAKAFPSKEDKDRLYHKWLHQLSIDSAYNKQLSKHVPGFELSPYMASVQDPLPGRPLPVILANNIDRQGCGYYRVIHPYTALEQQLYIDGGVNDTLIALPEIERLQPDVMLIQPGLRRGLSKYFEQVRTYSSAKIVIDYDDYSPNIPVRSMVRKHIKQDIIKDIRRDCAQADWVVVSTAPLADEFSRFTSNIRIAPNGLPVDIWGELKSNKRTKKKLRVGWAGGSTHTGDLSLIKPLIKAFEHEIEWVFMGMKPEGVQCEFHPGVPIEVYPEKLASLDLDLALVPLEINQFNICKSNLRLLELGACGIPVICTDIEPFRCGLPVTHVNNRYAEWAEAINMHIHEKEALERQGEELRKAIHENWMLRDGLLEKWRNAWLHL